MTEQDGELGRRVRGRRLLGKRREDNKERNMWKEEGIRDNYGS